MNTKELRAAIARHFKVEPEAVDPAFYTRGQTVHGYVSTASGRQRFDLPVDGLKPEPAKPTKPAAEKGAQPSEAKAND